MRMLGVLGAAIWHAACAQPRAPVVASDAIDVMPDLAPADAGEAHDESVDAAVTEVAAFDPAPLIARVEAVYAAPFELDFEQAFHFRSHNVTQQVGGHLAFAAPGRVNVTYTKRARIVVAGGVQTFEDTINRNYSMRSVATDFCPGPIAFAAPGTMASKLALEVIDGAKLSSPGTVVLVGRSRSPTLPRALYYVDQKSFEVKRVVFYDGSGNNTRYDFSNLAKQPTFAPSLFLPTPGVAFTPIGPVAGGGLATPLP
jgi:outer membrane lipoprotein-sorting protein